MPPNFTSIDHPLLRRQMQILAVDTDADFAVHLKKTLQNYVGRIETRNSYGAARQLIVSDPNSYNLIIIGASTLNEDLLNFVGELSNLNVLSMLVLVPNIDAKGVRSVLRRINTIGDCSEKTHDQLIIRRHIDAMVTLINDKANRALHPFGIF